VRRFRSEVRDGRYSDVERGSAIISPPSLVGLWTCFPKPVTGEIAKSARKTVILTDPGRCPAHELLVRLAFWDVTFQSASKGSPQILSGVHRRVASVLRSWMAVLKFAPTSFNRSRAVSPARLQFVVGCEARRFSHPAIVRLALD